MLETARIVVGGVARSLGRGMSFRSSATRIAARATIVLASAFFIVLPAVVGCSDPQSTRRATPSSVERSTSERPLEAATRKPAGRRRRAATNRTTPRRYGSSGRRGLSRPPRIDEAPTSNSASGLRRVTPTKRPAATDHPQPVSTAAGRPSPAADSVPPEVPMRVYHVQRNDTLWGLAQRFYGDSKHWRKILAANRKRVPDPRNLPVGIKLIIP